MSWNPIENIREILKDNQARKKAMKEMKEELREEKAKVYAETYKEAKLESVREKAKADAAKKPFSFLTKYPVIRPMTDEERTNLFGKPEALKILEGKKEEVK